MQSAIFQSCWLNIKSFLGILLNLTDLGVKSAEISVLEQVSSLGDRPFLEKIPGFFTNSSYCLFSELKVYLSNKIRTLGNS